MRVVPQSTVTLYKDVEIDNDEQLVFSSKAKQSEYFATKAYRSNVNCTVIKKTGAVKLAVSGADVAKCNYISFINPSFDNRTIYARITGYEYATNETTYIFYYIDYFQTWMFDVQFEDMYIERQHLSQSDWVKAEANPFDPSILQFRTAEPLAISPDLEKLHYQIDNTEEYEDGVKLFDATATLYSMAQNGTLVYMSDIALDALDETYDGETVKPSEWFNTFKSHILDTGVGFYKCGVKDTLHVGSEIPGGSIISSNMNTPYWIFYVPNNIITHNPFYSVDDLLEKLTTWGCISSVIGLYSLPVPIAIRACTAYTGQGQYEPITFDAKTSKDLQTVKSKKLMNYPFSYMRLIAPNGDIKELHYEMFKDLQDGTKSKCPIEVTLDVVGRPSMIACPVRYKMSGQDYNEVGENLSEGVIFGQIPTAPYNTDAFLAAVAAYAQQQIGNNTTAYGYELQQGLLDVYKQEAEGAKAAGNVATGTFKDIISLDWGGAANRGVDATFKNTQAELASNKFDLQANMSQDAYAALRGGQDNSFYSNYRETRPAYAANKYTPSTGDGLINYSYLHYLDIILLHVQLNSEVLKNYDLYFQNYGYNHGICSIPYVINYMHGSADADKIPHWETINGKQSTYVKTTNCKIIYSMLEVAQYIKALFDGGCRFLKGDSLISGGN